MEKINKAKAKLIFNNPLFGSLATKLKIVKSNTIDTYQKRGDILEINEEFINRLSLDEVSSIIANASLYQALFHQNRGENRIKSIWQAASDFAINDILVKNGFTLPPLAKYKASFEGMYAEEIYNLLLEAKEEFEEIKEERILNDLEHNLFTQTLFEKFSNNIADIERVIKVKKRAKLNWKELLRRYLHINLKSDYSLYPPNKRYLWQGIALPSISNKELKIAIAIDTSASIKDSDLEIFLKEIESIMQTFTSYKIILIEADFKIQNISIYRAMEPLKTTLKGGGGTDFRAVFEYLERLNEKFELLIYFSDGEGRFPTNPPPIKTLWVLTKDNKTPFGEKILIS